MSAADIAVKTILKLEPEDFQILETIENQTKKYQYLPIEIISNLADIHMQTTKHHLKRLQKQRLLTYQSQPYEGYRLTTAAYDTLALKALVDKNIIEKFGNPLGVGKESDVYDALTPDETHVAVKIHRLGRTSFRDVKRKRGYTTQYMYTPDWHKRSALAAKKDFPSFYRTLNTALRNTLILLVPLSVPVQAFPAETAQCSCRFLRTV